MLKLYASIKKIFEVLGCANEFKASTFPWLAGFVGKKAGPLEEQAKHFKWFKWGHFRLGIQEVMTDRVATVIRSHDITEVSSTTILLGACFTCGSTKNMARDCPKNGGNGGRGDDNDNQPATKGRVFSSTKDQATNSSGSGYHQKDRKPSQNDKTEHGMEKTVQNQGQSPKMPKSESILKNQQSNRSRN
ncbi:hypothetical protein Tco_0128994 [Tanacetum coccineum]